MELQFAWGVLFEMGRRIPFFAVAAVLVAGSGCAGSSPRPSLIVEQQGSSPVELYDLGASRLALGDVDGAEKAFRSALSVARKSGLDFAPPHEGLARVLLRRGKPDEARPEAELALELDRHWPRTFWVLGKISEGEDSSDMALAHYERGLYIAPGDAELTAAAVDLLRRLSRDREALEVLSRSEAVGRRSKGVKGDTMSARPAPAGPSAADTAIVPVGPKAAEPALPRAVRLLEPFFPRTVETLKPRVLAVFDQESLTRGALAILITGDGEHVLSRAFDRSVGPDEEWAHPPRDVDGRPEEPWIHRAVQLGLMDVLPDGTFRPDQVLSRMTLALWIEDTIARLRHDNRVYALYRGRKSPFPDVDDRHYGLNAARIAVDLKLLQPRSEGGFDPDEPVGLEEGVLAVRQLAPALMGQFGAPMPEAGPR